MVNAFTHLGRKNQETTFLEQEIKQISMLSPASIELLFDSIKRRQLSKREIVLREGQLCKCIYFIERGQLRTFYNKDGKDINISFSFENNFVTNLKSFVQDIPSGFFIIASEPTIVWEFEKRTIQHLFPHHSEINFFECRLINKLLMQLKEDSNLFKIYTPAERYHHIAKHHPRLLQRVSLSQLSSYLGISREAISRIRRKAHLSYSL
jgi:CRP-like cAMP-binding protein